MNKRYYKQVDENGSIIAIGTNSGGVEITKEEYDALLAEIIKNAEVEHEPTET